VRVLTAGGGSSEILRRRSGVKVIVLSELIGIGPSAMVVGAGGARCGG